MEFIASSPNSLFSKLHLNYNAYKNKNFSLCFLVTLLSNVKCNEMKAVFFSCFFTSYSYRLIFVLIFLKNTFSLT